MGIRSTFGRLVRAAVAPKSSGPERAVITPPSPSAAAPTEAAGDVRGQVTQAGRMDLPAPGPGLEEGLEVEVPVPGSVLLDVREPGEMASGVAVGAMLLPMDLVPHHLLDLPRDRLITVYCAAGARSAGVAHWLREQGWQAVSLAGGIGALRYGGVEVRVPSGARPGTKVTLVDAALGPGTHRGEVVEQVGERLRVRVFDATGLQVLVEAPASVLEGSTARTLRPATG